MNWTVSYVVVGKLWDHSIYVADSTKCALSEAGCAVVGSTVVLVTSAALMLQNKYVL